MIIDEAKVMQAARESLRLAAFDTFSAMSNRIFIDGKRSSGRTMGKYSKKPFYANPNTSPVATNKTGKTGNKIQGGYYAGGYAEYRAQQGRESGFKNLRLTGDLQSDFNNSSSGFTLQETGDMCYVISIDKPENVKKVEGQESELGPIFTEFTKKEERLLEQSLRANIINKLRSL